MKAPPQTFDDAPFYAEPYGREALQPDFETGDRTFEMYFNGISYRDMGDFPGLDEDGMLFLDPRTVLPAAVAFATWIQPDTFGRVALEDVCRREGNW